MFRKMAFVKKSPIVRYPFAVSVAAMSLIDLKAKKNAANYEGNNEHPVPRKDSSENPGNVPSYRA